MITKKFKNGETIKQLITDNGSLLLVQTNTTGLPTAFAYADILNDLSELTPIVVLEGISNGSTEFVCDNSAVVLSNTGEIFMRVKGDVHA